MPREILSKKNFTSNYLGLLKNRGIISEICDSDGMPISTINISPYPQPIKYFPPKLIYDGLESVSRTSVLIRLKTLGEVNEKGFKLISRKIKGWNKGQYVEYKIVKSTKEVKEVTYFPKQHVAIWDKINKRMKLKGPNCRDVRNIKGETEWAYLGDKIVDEVVKDKRFIKLIKDAIPVLVADDGAIVCLPHRHEPNNIAIVGKKGTGKTLMIHRIIEEIFFHLKERVIIMNDIQEECETWNTPQQNPMWIDNLRRIGERPIALPIIYVYPHSNTLNLDYLKARQSKEFVQISIPFSEVINNPYVYLNLKEEGSGMYILGIKEDLLKCNKPQEVIELIGEKFPGNTMTSMRNKMLVGFQNIFNEEILNISNKECPYKIAINQYKGNPFVILARSRIIPCFESSDLENKRYMAEVLAYHLNCVFKSKFHNGLLYNKTTYVAFDELTQICSDDNKNSSYEALCSIATRGRKNKLGIIYATQNYTKIPKKIQNNTDFVFAFQHSNIEEVNKIKKDFDLGKLDIKEILNLEDFEVVGITNEHFVCYKGSKKYLSKGPICGRLIPPQSNHFHPRS